MINIENSFLKKFIPDELCPEEKKEHELNAVDRMHLINKKLDENFLCEIYDNIIDAREWVYYGSNTAGLDATGNNRFGRSSRYDVKNGIEEKMNNIKNAVALK
jgi:hypothetical protein